MKTNEQNCEAGNHPNVRLKPTERIQQKSILLMLNDIAPNKSKKWVNRQSDQMQTKFGGSIKEQMANDINFNTVECFWEILKT